MVMGQRLSPDIGDEARLELFRMMVLIRTFEQATLRAARAQLAPSDDTDAGDADAGSVLQLAAGREPVAVGVCAHLDATDALTAARRPHHLAIAHGVQLGKLADETLGQTRADPDLHHPWHLFDPDTDFTSSASIAEGFPPALGRAFAFRQDETDRVAVTVTDQDTTAQDGFTDALELATLWSLPLVFVVEDDRWDTEPRSVPYLPDGTNGTTVDYGVPAERVEDNSVETIYEAAGRAIEHARTGGGPSVLEVHTVRLDVWPGGQRIPEFREDLTDRAGTDPLPTYERALRNAGVLDAGSATAIRTEAAERVAGTIGPPSDEHATDVRQAVPTGPYDAWDENAAT